jgi:hypothetical protein
VKVKGASEIGIRTFCLWRKIVRRCRPLCPPSLNLLVNVEGHAGGEARRVIVISDTRFISENHPTHFPVFEMFLPSAAQAETFIFHGIREICEIRGQILQRHFCFPCP